MSDWTALEQAIANAEGYGQPGAIPTVANNPGDLELGDQGSGTLGGGITIFPTASAGLAALKAQLSSITSGSSKNYNKNMTLAEMGQKWSSGNPAWANNVATTLGVSTDTPISTILDGNNPNSTTTDSGTGSWLSDLSQAYENGQQQAATIAQNATGNESLGYSATQGYQSSTVEKYVVIGIGLLLIAGGIFGFNKVHETVIQVAKEGAKVAA